MKKQFPWKRFWCRREDSFSLADRGFLSDPVGDHGTVLNPKLTTLEQLQTTACLALLGEPGVGKSWSLAADVDAFLKESPDLEVVRLDLRSFGSEDRLYRALFEHPTFLHWVNGDHELHVYLDSFDECLLRIDTVAAILADELPKYPLHRLRLRIACRTASWPTVLENALKKGYGDDNFAATELVPLRRADVLEAAALTGITNPKVFLERVDQLKLASLAGKPIALKMLLDTYQREGDLPTNLVSLYEKGCLILCEEQNESRRAAGRAGKLSATGRLAVASRIAAVTQLGNHFAVWKGTEAAGIPPEDVSVAQLVGGTEIAEHAIDVSHEMIAETLGTGLFSSRGEERLGWSHQTFAEYLAARYCLAHGLSIEQLRSLVFHPRRARVIPQVREIASWLALQNAELFGEIAEKDPEVLLGSAAPSLSAEQRRVLTDALLRSCDQSEILHVHHNLVLRHLAHPALAEQLQPVLRDRNRAMSTRYFAVQVARACTVAGLGDDLLDIALSEEEHNEVRTVSAYAIADIGSEPERERMRPLLMTTREADPNDQLRGAALSAIYPEDKYDDAMWEYLEHPRQSLYFGAYSNFLDYAVVPKLNAQNVPAALAWCQQQPIDDIGPVSELEGNIFALAVEHIEAPGVAERLAQAMLQRCRSYRGFPERRHSKGKSPEEVLREDDVRRRRFLAAFVPLLNPGNVHILMHPLSILNGKDLEWFIQRIESGASPNPLVEARLVQRLACSWESSGQVKSDTSSITGGTLDGEQLTLTLHPGIFGTNISGTMAGNTIHLQSIDSNGRVSSSTFTRGSVSAFSTCAGQLQEKSAVIHVNANLASQIRKFSQTAHDAEAWIQNAQLHAGRIPAAEGHYNQIQNEMRQLVERERRTSGSVDRSQISVDVNQKSIDGDQFDIEVNQTWEWPIEGQLKTIAQQLAGCTTTCSLRGAEMPGTNPTIKDQWESGCRAILAEQSNFQAVAQKIIEQRSELKTYQANAKSLREATVTQAEKLAK